MATKGFTKINNSIAFDSNLSLEALGLYVKLQYLSTIDNFSIKREHVKSISGYGETAFRRVWKELKDKHVLIESKTSNKGRYEYIYTLKTDEGSAIEVAPVKKKKPKHVDSNGDSPLDGQISIEDILYAEQQQNVHAKEDIEVVAEVTGLNIEEVNELLEVAKNDANKVIECYRYSASQENVLNIFNYTKWAIKNSKALTDTVPRMSIKVKAKGSFDDYPQREYDFADLERKLLGWG